MFWVVAPLSAMVVVGVLVWAGGSMADPDVWWHVATGRLILDELSVPHTDPWSFTAESGRWIPTAWLSDTLFAVVWHLGGYDGVRVLRVVLAAAVITAIWNVARRSAASPPAALSATALVVLAVGPYLRERPQVISYVFVAWLALRVQRVLAGQLPAVLPVVLLTYLWANLHGLWVLAPIAFLGAGVLAWFDDRSRVALAARCSLTAGLCVIVAALTPAGPRVAYWPLVVQRAAAPITEWEPTRPLTALALPFVVMLTVIVLRWARSSDPVPASRIGLVLAVALFGLLAYRNLAPAAILLLPELVRASPRADHTPIPAPVARAAGGVLVAGVALALVHLASSPTASSSQPTRIAANLADRPNPLRVLNAYDVGGLLTGTASPPAQVAIDGRTDMWSAAYVRDYLDTIEARGDWRVRVDDLRPDVAVLARDSNLARALVAERGWRVTLVDGPWALLEPAQTAAAAVGRP